MYIIVGGVKSLLYQNVIYCQFDTLVENSQLFVVEFKVQVKIFVQELKFQSSSINIRSHQEEETEVGREKFGYEIIIFQTSQTSLNFHSRLILL